MLPRPSRGEYDGFYREGSGYKDLGRMLNDIQAAIRETGESVLCHDEPRRLRMGFVMHQIVGDDEYSWGWYIRMGDLQQCLFHHPHMRAWFLGSTQRVELAKRLAETAWSGRDALDDCNDDVPRLTSA